MTNEPAPQQRFAPIALWRAASRLMVTLFNLFGEPQDLAFRHTLVARDYKAALNWLRSVEALFRKLLLIEASHYANEMAQTKQRTPSKRVPNKLARKLVSFCAENPDAWRVSFRTNMERGRPRPQHSIGQASAVAQSPRHAGEDTRAPYLAPTSFHSAWPLAERFEALLRVHNDPAPYAKRLARRLYAKPDRIAAITSEPTELQHRIDPEPYAEITALARACAPNFRRAPNTS